MLEAAGVPFEPIDAPLDEEAVKAELRPRGLGAAALAAALAERKALSASAAPKELVLGCDQTLELDDCEMLDKPQSREDAFRQLRRMSGREHRLHSAAAIAVESEVIWSGAETVRLWVRPLSDAFISTYLDREYEEIRWSVGGYRIEGPGVQLFERIEGSHFAILGLPLLPLLGYLRGQGIIER